MFVVASNHTKPDRQKVKVIFIKNNDEKFTPKYRNFKIILLVVPNTTTYYRVITHAIYFSNSFQWKNQMVD